MPTSLKMLGSFEAFVEDRPATTNLNLAALLLCYLAERGGWTSREHLLGLLWPDADPPRARRNLRQMLHRARSLAWGEPLETTPTHVRFAVDSDVKAFRDAVDAARWNRAVELYDGPFLEGAATSGVAGLESWHGATQQSLNGLWSEALERRAEILAGAGRHRSAARLLAAGLERDPLAENLLAAYMRSRHAAGQRDRALDAYAAFETRLRDELDLRPLETTERLAEAITEAAPLAGAPAATGSAAPPPIGAKMDPASLPVLPEPATPFVGRSAELAALRRMLEDPDERLVTLTGIGGIGKSRLALELARLQRPSAGAAFVPLADVGSPASLPSAIAAALGLTVRDGEAVEPQLHAFLRRRELLLVLDNFEHLLAGADRVAELIAAAPALHLVVTSREALGLAAERRFPLDGLVHPDADDAPESGAAPFSEPAAVELFARSARRVDARFRLDATTRAAVHRICDRLDGVPLALELAAAWTPLLSVDAIAAELDASFDLLRVAPTDAPARHASLGAVFDHSWDLLGDRARTTLAALAVFRGGFTADAAARVAGARPTDLLGLQRASLLRRTSKERFDLHPLVGRFAADRLAADAELAERTAGRHAEHYLGALDVWSRDLRTERQVAALTAIRTDWANVRAAWSAAVARRRSDLLEAAHEGCRRFLVLTSDLAEGVGLFAELADAYRDEGGALFALAEARCAGFQIMLGRLDAAEATLRRCLARDPEPAERAFVLRQLASLAHLRGEHRERGAKLRAALSQCERQPGLPGHVEVLSNLAVHAWATGDYPRARAHAEACLELAERRGDREYGARQLVFLGMIANAEGRFDEAIRRLREAVPQLEAIEDRVQYGFAKGALGYAHWRRGDYAAALAPAQEAYALFTELNHSFYLAMSAYGLGETLRGLEGPDRAEPYFREALATALEHSVTNWVLNSLFGFAELYRARDPDPDRAAELLVFVRDHDATWAMDRVQAEDALDELGIDAERRAELAERIRGWRLEDVAARVLAR